jgi:hypothetical protein
MNFYDKETHEGQYRGYPETPTIRGFWMCLFMVKSYLPLKLEALTQFLIFATQAVYNLKDYTNKDLYFIYFFINVRVE